MRPFRLPSCFVVFLVLVGLTGCVSVQVEPLSLQPYPPRPGGATPMALEAEPAQAHVNLARFIATSNSDYVDEDTLRGKILAAADRYGADAVVMGKYDLIESTRLGQTYQSTNAPGLGNSLFGGMGSGMPFFFDPWTYVQAPVDRVEYLQYQSGVAIRYVDGARPGLN
ncbi:MAG: hypothetical protein KGL03_04275 [Nitrospirota bacterium]|nr:hypothetical protein [Nitrospirota bacterium]MDE3225769.1 hypothetical protein [Nitrospirota bacterium]